MASPKPAAPTQAAQQTTLRKITRAVAPKPAPEWPPKVAPTYPQ